MRQVKGVRKKAEYFWMYYKIQFLAAAAAAVVVIYFGYAKATEKDYALYAMLLDIHTDVSESNLEDEFSAYAGIDQNEYEVLILTSLLFSDTSSSNYALTSLARFQTAIGTEDLDVALMLEDDFETYADADCYMDLREVFTEEELTNYGELYTDEDGSVLGIYVNELSKIQEIEGYYGEDDRAVAGIIYNTQRVDMAREFLEYLNS